MTASHLEAPAEDLTTPPELDTAPAANGGPPSLATRTSIYGTLSSVSVTADRERTRLQRSAGRVGPIAWIMRFGLGLRYLGTAQAALRGLRYRPVAWLIIAIVALSFFLPGRIDWTSSPVRPAGPSPVAVAPVTPQPAALDVSGSEPVITAPPPAPFEAPAPTPTPAPPAAPEDTDSEPPAAPVVDDSDPVVMPTDDPLAVRGYGWASRLPANPLGAGVPVAEVAEATAPVAMRLGMVDRVAFVRLDGTATTLELVEHADSSSEPLGPAAVAICPILDDDWIEAGGQDFDDAPDWDEESCVSGVENNDRWSFDLSSFGAAGDGEHADIVSDRGFALVPTDEAPPEFSIAFEMPDGLAADGS